MTGASDIIAEDLSDDPDIRKRLRELFHRRGSLVCKAADPNTDSVYRLYYDFNAPISKLMDHQIMAMNRGEKEGLLKITVQLPGNEGQAVVCRGALKPIARVCPVVRAAAEDAYDRLILPSVSRRTSLPRIFPTIRISASACGNCSTAGEAWCARRQTRIRTACTGCTMISMRPSPS